ncbi:MAG: lysylphosphatidylglycerol synthase domain-containing protein [Deltaproteobacteria bacterium]|nr:lysylphosphatidylglycerol synthase domain-containing protein [Deltaproteobacteria bacterium]
MKNRAVRLGAWAFAVAILVYLLVRIPLAEVGRALSQAAPWTVPVIIGMVFVVYAADTFAAWKTFSWFAAPLTYREALTVKGASYILAMVNYAVGQGAFAYFLHKTKAVSLLRSAATVLLIMGTNVLLLLLLATAGLALSRDIPDGAAGTLATARVLAWAGYGGLAVYIALLMVKPAFIARRELFSVLFEAGVAGHAKALAARLPHIMSLVVFAYLYLYAFGVKVPPLQALLFLPISFLVAAIPLPGQGLGAVQAIMIAVFLPYAPGTRTQGEAAVFAASITGWTLAIVVQMVIGLVCLRSQLATVLTKPSPTTEG